MENSPVPWVGFPNGTAVEDGYVIQDANGDHVAHIEKAEDANLIVALVNKHFEAL